MSQQNNVRQANRGIGFPSICVNDYYIMVLQSAGGIVTILFI